MNYRSERVIKDNLKDNSKDITKDALIMTGCTAIMICSIYGTIVLGQDLIDFYQAGETLTLQTKFLADLEEAKVGYAMMPGILSGLGIYHKSKNLKENIQYRKSLKRQLNNLKNK